MTRPKLVVNVAAALQRRGAPTDTGVAFMVYAGATGSTDVVECYAKSDAVASAAPDTIAQYVADALNQGAPKVVLVRAAAVNTAAVTQAEWATALAKFVDGYGPGQVLIPGVTTTAAYDALLAHADTAWRTALLDAEADATESEIATIAATLAAASGAERATILAGWPVMPGPGGVTRQIPGSVAAAGLVGRNDAYIGHANATPAGDQGRGAGFVTSALGLSTLYTDSEHDALNDAGVSVFRVIRGQVQLYGWVSLSTEDNFKQLNWGRMAMQLKWGIAALAEKFLFRQIDGQGRLYAELEGGLRGYLKPLYVADALYGATDADAYDVTVAGVNTPATAAAGELHAAVAVSLSAHTELVIVDVTTTIATGVNA